MDSVSINIKEHFKAAKEELFQNNISQQNPLSFSMEYSLLVEDLIRSIARKRTYPFAMVSAGSFSRRELSPFSDIDIIFIVDSLEGIEDEISTLIHDFWDSGLEVSHTIRDFNDITKYLSVDLKTFTQFFETRFLLGNEDIYSRWNSEIFNAIDETAKVSLLNKFVEEIEERYRKYGDSPKVLEPNVKLTAGGLRDFQLVEWMFIIYTKNLFNRQNELSQAESFIEVLSEQKYTSNTECFRLLHSYRLILAVRNLLHFMTNQKNDRFEFKYQERVAAQLSHKPDNLNSFMKEYFEATNSINRFLKSMIKKFQEEINNPLPDSLSFNIDDDFAIKGKEISLASSKALSLSDILRSFYYRGFYGGYFDEKLRTKVIETIENKSMFKSTETESSAFFREILRLPKNVGVTLSVMNELGVIGAFIPEWNELVGFFQPGVYHCYTVDEHTLIAIINVENLEKENSLIARTYKSIKNKEILFLSLLLHDIAKPVDISGHEIIGAELTSSIMTRMGYSDEEIDRVMFLVRNHLVMEQTAFRRNLNDPETLNNFAAKFNSLDSLEMLFLLTFGDLSAVNSAVWTSWKSDLASELFIKTKEMIEEQITGEELLSSPTLLGKKRLTRLHDRRLREHIESMNDISYQYHFSEEEILEHVAEIQKGELISVIFNTFNNFTNITVITKDFPSLLSKICGVLAINDMNIHDARIFTRKDKIVIDTFNVTDFRTHKKIEETRYAGIRNNLRDVVLGLLQLNVEFENMRSRWKRLESILFKRSGKVKVVFDKHEKFTIIEIHSPDRLGFLYQVTSKMTNLGLVIYFAKISTKGDDIVDSFYVLTNTGKKVSSTDYEFFRNELTESISQIL